MWVYGSRPGSSRLSGWTAAIRPELDHDPLEELGRHALEADRPRDREAERRQRRPVD